jgi:hypothetical protein
MNRKAITIPIESDCIETTLYGIRASDVADIGLPIICSNAIQETYLEFMAGHPLELPCMEDIKIGLQHLAAIDRERVQQVVSNHQSELKDSRLVKRMKEMGLIQ